jgi:hypothetical protein
VLDNETQAPTNGEMNSASDTFITELKPLLSQESLTALNNPDSPQSQSLQWLLEKSNFQAWPFPPTSPADMPWPPIYYATGGDWSWSNAGGNWLTNETECLWFQGSRGDFCGKNGTALQSLNQSRKHSEWHNAGRNRIADFSPSPRPAIEPDLWDCAVGTWILDCVDHTWTLVTMHSQGLCRRNLVPSPRCRGCHLIPMVSKGLC